VSSDKQNLKCTQHRVWKIMLSCWPNWEYH